VIVFVNAVTACGVKVKSAVFLDPMTHPKAFGIPKGVRTLTIYSVNFAGVGKGMPMQNTTEENISVWRLIRMC